MKILKISFTISLLFILISFQYNILLSKILMKPYLQAVTQNSIYVLAECDSKNDVIVSYSSDSKYDKVTKTELISSTSNNTFVHKIKLKKLEPNSVYYYKVRQDAGWTEPAYFRTALPPGISFTFAAMGDCRSNSKVHSKIAELMLDKKPYFSVYSGDLCYDGSYDSWKSEFFVPEELILSAQVPFFNAIGNHESWTQDTRAFLHSPESNSGVMDYYSFDYGDVHFLAINSEEEIKKNSKQYEFIEKDLKNTDRKWKFAIFHKPAYCAGGHGDNNNMIKICSELLEPNKVDIVIAGHSHFYQHNFKNGIHHFIIAGGGAPLYKPSKKDYVLKSRKVHHYGIFDVTTNTIKLTIYDSKDKIIDNIELKK